MLILYVKTGCPKMPYLVDDERNVEMYELADIDAYLRAYYANK